MLGKWRKSVFWHRGDLMLMKDYTAVSNQLCMPVNLLGGAFFYPGLLSTRSKVIKYKYVKNQTKS